MMCFSGANLPQGSGGEAFRAWFDMLWAVDPHLFWAKGFAQNLNQNPNVNFHEFPFPRFGSLHPSWLVGSWNVFFGCDKNPQISQPSEWRHHEGATKKTDSWKVPNFARAVRKMWKLEAWCTPPKTNECPLKSDNFNRKCIWTKHQFSGDIC